jgi:predicted solute-binding protein
MEKLVASKNCTDTERPTVPSFSAAAVVVDVAELVMADTVTGTSVTIIVLEALKPSHCTVTVDVPGDCGTRYTLFKLLTSAAVLEVMVSIPSTFKTAVELKVTDIVSLFHVRDRLEPCFVTAVALRDKRW